MTAILIYAQSFTCCELSPFFIFVELYWAYCLPVRTTMTDVLGLLQDHYLIITFLFYLPLMFGLHRKCDA